MPKIVLRDFSQATGELHTVTTSNPAHSREAVTPDEASRLIREFVSDGVSAEICHTSTYFKDVWQVYLCGVYGGLLAVTQHHFFDVVYGYSDGVAGARKSPVHGCTLAVLCKNQTYLEIRSDGLSSMKYHDMPGAFLTEYCVDGSEFRAIKHKFGFRIPRNTLDALITALKETGVTEIKVDESLL